MRNWRSEKGAALVEAAVTLPLLLLVSVGIFEFGRAYQTWQVLTNAAREGARVAVLPDVTAASVDAARPRLHAGGAARALRHGRRHGEPFVLDHRERRRGLRLAGHGRLSVHVRRPAAGREADHAFEPRSVRP